MSKPKQKAFRLKRSIDYTVEQAFVVVATTQDEAQEALANFADGSDWSEAASKKYGVVQVSDEIDQIENSDEITCEGAVDLTNPKLVEQSYVNICMEGIAIEMLTMLRKVAETPNHREKLNAIALEAKALVDAFDAELDAHQHLVDELLSKIKGR